MPAKLLLLSRGWWQGGLSCSDWVSCLALQQPKQLAGGCTGQATADLATALALGGAAGHIAFGWLVPGLAEHHDRVQRSVQLSITAPVDSLGRRGCQVGVRSG